MTYAEQLKDPRWQKKRLEILKRDKFTCRLCGDKSTTLHIHHNNYKGNPWDVSNDELMCLCCHCHSVVEYYKEQNAAQPAKVIKFKWSTYYWLYAIDINPANGLVAILIFEYNTSTNEVVFTSGVNNENLDLISKAVRKLKNKYRFSQELPDAESE